MQRKEKSPLVVSNFSAIDKFLKPYMRKSWKALLERNIVPRISQAKSYILFSLRIFTRKQSMKVTILQDLLPNFN